MCPRRQQNVADTTAARKRRPVWLRFLRGLTAFVDTLVVVALLLTGYAGCVSPLGHVTWWVGLVACGGPVLTYFPLHVTTPKAPEGAEQFSLLTYNILDGVYAEDGNTEVADYILSTNADIVCTQETYAIALPRRDATTQARVDSLRAGNP